MFLKGNHDLIAEFHKTDLYNGGHSREGKPPFYSQKYTVLLVTKISRWGGGAILSKVRLRLLKKRQRLGCCAAAKSIIPNKC